MTKSIFDIIADRVVDSICDDEWIGRRGEKLTERELKWVRLFGRKGKILRNLYVPKSDGTTSEIDVVYISAKGIFVIESKNYSGWIFGNDSQNQWTVCLKGGVKKRFYNPVMQNRGHIKHLRSYVSDEIPLFSIIAFSERCELKKVTIDTPGVHVIKRDKLYVTVKRIWDSSPDVLTDSQVDDLHKKLFRLTDTSEAEKQAHIKSIEERYKTAERHVSSEESAYSINPHAAEEAAQKVAEPPLCPKCGSQMVLRTAKRGDRAGKQFYGCSRYPHCRGIVNID